MFWQIFEGCYHNHDVSPDRPALCLDSQKTRQRVFCFVYRTGRFSNYPWTPISMKKNIAIENNIMTKTTGMRYGGAFLAFPDAPSYHEIYIEITPSIAIER